MRPIFLIIKYFTLHRREVAYIKNALIAAYNYIIVTFVNSLYTEHTVYAKGVLTIKCY